MKLQLERLIHDKVKVAMTICLLILPSLDVFFILRQSVEEIPYPLYATFLTGYSRGHILQSLYLWFVPLYFLLLAGDSCIEDYQTGYIHVLIAKEGRMKYLRNRLSAGFWFPFAVMMAGLLLNLLVVCVACRNGSFSQYGGEYAVYDAVSMPETFLFEISYTHPFLANIIYMFVVSFLGGLMGMVGTMLAAVVHERRIVYPITFALWLLPLLMRNSSMFLFQPFTEYGLDVLVPLFVWMTALYLAVVIETWVWEVKLREI